MKATMCRFGTANKKTYFISCTRLAVYDTVANFNIGRRATTLFFEKTKNDSRQIFIKKMSKMSIDNKQNTISVNVQKHRIFQKAHKNNLRKTNQKENNITKTIGKHMHLGYFKFI